MERHNRKISNYVLCVCIYALLNVFCIRADAHEIDIPEPVKIRCTCYTAPAGKGTASGGTVHEGIVAGKREWFGCVAVLYDMDMNFIGFYEFTDTGAGIDTDGDGVGDSIKRGKSIDVYRTTLDRCYEWVAEYGDYVYMQIYEAEG